MFILVIVFAIVVSVTTYRMTAKRYERMVMALENEIFNLKVKLRAIEKLNN